MCVTFFFIECKRRRRRKEKSHGSTERHIDCKNQNQLPLKTNIYIYISKNNIDLVDGLLSNKTFSSYTLDISISAIRYIMSSGYTLLPKKENYLCHSETCIMCFIFLLDDDDEIVFI